MGQLLIWGPDIYWLYFKFNYCEAKIYETRDFLNSQLEEGDYQVRVYSTNEYSLNPLIEWEGYYQIVYRDKTLGFIHVIPSTNNKPGSIKNHTRLVFDVRWPPGPFIHRDANGKDLPAINYPDYFGVFYLALDDEHKRLFGDNNPQDESESEILNEEIKQLEAPKVEARVKSGRKQLTAGTLTEMNKSALRAYSYWQENKTKISQEAAGEREGLNYQQFKDQIRALKKSGIIQE